MTRRLAVPIGIFFSAVLAGVLLVLLPGKVEAPTAVSEPYADLIVVDSPKQGSALSSPIIISGKARGTWYFEASFPLEIQDASGAIVGVGHAEAQSDWMTTEFVPFEATLMFSSQTAGSKGKLVLKKDNPSGLPEHDDSITIPVIFK